MTAPSDRTVTEIVGVYDADGSLRGELAYALGILRGKPHCELCDITHAGVRRRKGIAQLPDRLGVPLSLVHRDERSPEVLEFTRDRTPIVVGRTEAGFVDLLLAEDLAHVETSADGLYEALCAALAAKQLRLAA